MAGLRPRLEVVFLDGVGVLLIGPPAVGKTEVGRRLAARLGLAFVDADDLCGQLYADYGWTPEAFAREKALAGAHAAYLTFEAAVAYAVGRILAAHRHSVVALGAGHSHCVDPRRQQEVAQSVQASGMHVVLLLPHHDPEEAVAILRQRIAGRGDDDYRRGDRDLLTEWVTSQQNQRLATQLLITAGETPDDTAARLAGFLQSS